MEQKYFAYICANHKLDSFNFWAVNGKSDILNKTISSVHDRVYRKERALKYQNATLQKEEQVTNYVQ